MLSLIYKASSFNRPLPISSREGLIKVKRFLLENRNFSPILQESLHHMDELESRLTLLTPIDLSSYFSTGILYSNKENRHKSYSSEKKLLLPTFPLIN